MRCKNTLAAHLGIEFIEIGNDYIIAKMPVDNRTRQTFGLLHGGASMALAETVGSIAANLIIDITKQYAVGLEINGNHVSSRTQGWVFGKAFPYHLGKNTHVWGIEITDEESKLVSVGRITMAILDRRK